MAVLFLAVVLGFGQADWLFFDAILSPWCFA